MSIQVLTQQTCYVVNPPTPLNTPWFYTSTEQDFLRVSGFSPLHCHSTNAIYSFAYHRRYTSLLNDSVIK